MALRFLVAIVLGAVMGWEREYIGKEAGIRTSILISGGACLFTMIGLVLPYAGAVGIIANVVVGVGFLGAGVIIKSEDHNHIHNITTAAVVWAVAAIGTLVGIGMMTMAAFSAILLTILLFSLRNLHIAERRSGKSEK